MSVQDKTAGKRRGQALTGALAGVAVIAVLVAVFVGIQVRDDDDKKGQTAAAAATSATRIAFLNARSPSHSTLKNPAFAAVAPTTRPAMP